MKTSIKSSKSTSNIELLNPARQEITEQILKALDENVIPWRKEWSTNSLSSPYNYTNKKAYQGNNLFILTIASLLNSFDDPRWMTFKQASERNFQIKKGSKGVKIEYWYAWDKLQNIKIDLKEYNHIIRLNPDRIKDFKICTRCYVVFNGSQIDGIPPFDIQSENKAIYNIHEALESIIESIGVGFKHVGSEAYYMPVLDRVVMPAVDAFDSEIAYHATALHELAHATMHKSRLDRKEARESGGMKTEAYAVEELRAEFASMFLTQELGFDILSNTLDNHAAYINHWKAMIHDKPNILFDSIKDANTISDYLFEHSGLAIDVEIANSDEVHELTM